MTQKLIEKAKELRKRGFTTGEIADQLNVSIDTAQWLTIQTSISSEPQDAPNDIAINWNNISGSAARLRYASAAMADAALKYGPVDIIVGITSSGVPFATLIADYLDIEQETNTGLAIFHPTKHRDDAESAGVLSANFSSVQDKKVMIVDDVITSGKTIQELINFLKAEGATPVVVTVLIDKTGLQEIEDVPVESLIKVSRV